MPELRAALYDIYSLEALSVGASAMHALDARAKAVGTLFYIAALLSFGQHELSALAPFVLYPAAALSVAGVPLRMMMRRFLTALPFCLFAAISSVFFDRAPLFSIFGVTVTSGWLIFFSIMFRALLCVAAVLALIATTPMYELTRALRRMRVPEYFVFLFEMTCRYAGTLSEEALSMRTACALRGGGVRMRDMGSFAGRLLLRSFARAERVCAAMRCRGWGGGDVLFCGGRALRSDDYIFLALLCGSSLFFRTVNVPQAVGKLLICLF